MMTGLSRSRTAPEFLALTVVWSMAAASAQAAGADIVNGYRRFNSACNHCHGPDGVGSTFAPSLIASPIDAATFRRVVLLGRTTGASVMKGFGDDPNIAPYVDDIHA